MESAVNKLLGNRKNQNSSQNNSDIAGNFQQFYKDFIASGKNPMQELQNKLSTGQITQQQLNEVIAKAKTIAPLINLK